MVLIWSEEDTRAFGFTFFLLLLSLQISNCAKHKSSTTTVGIRWWSHRMRPHVCKCYRILAVLAFTVLVCCTHTVCCVAVAAHPSISGMPTRAKSRPPIWRWTTCTSWHQLARSSLRVVAPPSLLVMKNLSVYSVCRVRARQEITYVSAFYVQAMAPPTDLSSCRWGA